MVNENMTTLSSTSEQPTVFISYSHDSEEHKQWVKNLATQLMQEGGINVLLDVWETEGGDDLAMYMVHGVRDAKRVIMICSVPYSEKSDEGNGGVGFEVQIVTGELIKNLGSRKFIPVIPPGNQESRVPLIVNTKKYLDMRSDETYKTSFDELVKTIRDIAIYDKPKISLAERFTIQESHIPNVSPESSTSQTPYDVFIQAHDIIKTDDFIDWRSLFSLNQQKCRAELVKFKQEHEAHFDIKTVEDCAKMVLEASAIFSPVIAIALAGVASGKDKFKKQLAIISDILKPEKWNGNGRNILVELPEAITFIYQGLNGALCIQTEQIDLACELANYPIVFGNRYGDAAPLYSRHSLVSHIESLGRNMVDCIRFLYNLPTNDLWNWTTQLFDSVVNYQACISAYYIILALSDIACGIEHKNGPTDELYFHVLPLFWFGSRQVSEIAEQKILGNCVEVKQIWERRNISKEAMIKGWSIYYEKNGSQSYVFDYWLEDTKDFFEHLIEQIQ